MAFDLSIRHRQGDCTINVDCAGKGGITALFGPSGSGKTSVLHMIAGLIRPDAGRIIVNGIPLFDSDAALALPIQDRRAGYIFQDGRLFPHLRVRDNLLYGRNRAQDSQGVMSLSEVTDFLGIAPLLDRWPRTLSGGEAQRVAIGRALLSGPRFLLMDEPLSSLDQARREEILSVIERLRDEMHLPILYVSHDRTEVERLASSIITL